MKWQTVSNPGSLKCIMHFRTSIATPPHPKYSHHCHCQLDLTASNIQPPWSLSIWFHCRDMYYKLIQSSSMTLLSPLMCKHFPLYNMLPSMGRREVFSHYSLTVLTHTHLWTNWHNTKWRQCSTFEAAARTFKTLFISLEVSWFTLYTAALNWSGLI